jgi:teichuronic acid biosynthesis glycosyltransferase TuaC
MRVLSVSSVYPNRVEPGLGLFVLARLTAMAKRVPLKIVAPVPFVDYTNPKGKFWRGRSFPLATITQTPDVIYPRWIFPPFGTVANILCLFARIYPVLRRLRSAFPFELIDAHFAYPEGVAVAMLARAFRVPYVITLRGSEPAFAAYRSRKLVMQWALRGAAKIIAVSEELRWFAGNLSGNADKTVTIPNGVDPAIFHSRDRLSVRTKHNISHGRKLIISAGELIEAKGHQHVAEAVRELLLESYDVELLIVGRTGRGGPKYEDKLKKSIQLLGLADRIRFAGWADRETVAELLSAADVFCLASHTEGWPNVVHEALACGTPVVATHVGAIPEMIPSDKYGFIVPVKDHSSLVKCLKQALGIEWDRNQIAKWGMARTWDHVASEVVAVFESVIAESKTTAVTASARQLRRSSSEFYVRD